MTARILVTVSRSYRELSTMREALEQTHARLPHAVLVHGDDEDSDHKARGIWRGLGGADEPWPADWPHCTIDCPRAAHRKIRRRTGEEYCPGAGHHRNRAMVESAPALVLAFIDPKSRTNGAKSTADLAEEAGITTLRYVQGKASPELANADWNPDDYDPPGRPIESVSLPPIPGEDL